MNNYYFDKIISVQLFKLNKKGVPSTDSKDILSITPSSSGLKPDIELEISLLPQQLCYQATVRIKNFMYVPNIREYEYMSVEAGYYRGPSFTPFKQVQKFNISIFTSYQESPNPDGVTVFKGLTVGNTCSYLINRSIHVKVYGETTVKNLIEKVALGASGEQYATEYYTKNNANLIKVLNYIPAELNASKISLSRGLTGDNGLALLSDLYYTLYDFFKKDGLTYIQQFNNGTLTAGILGWDPRLTVTESVLPIISVYSASFNAQLLTILAPWDPLAEPGRVVRISTNYFNGNMAPNTLGNLREPAQLGVPTAAELKSGEGLYRILTSKINFDTCGNTNKMELMLLPINYAKEEEVGSPPTATYEKLVKSKEKALEVVIGIDGDKKDTERLFASGVKGSYSYTEETLLVGTTFTALANKYYGTEDFEDFYILKSKYNKEMVETIKDDGSLVMFKWPSIHRGINVGRSWAWPLILAATYTAYKSGSPEYKVDLKDPDTLPAGTKVRIPVLPSSNDDAVAQLAADKDLFKAMGDYYIDYINNSSKPWAKEHAVKAYNMYLLAGGTL